MDGQVKACNDHTEAFSLRDKPFLRQIEAHDDRSVDLA